MVCDREWQMSVSLLGTTSSFLLVSKADMLERDSFEANIFPFVGKDNIILSM